MNYHFVKTLTLLLMLSLHGIGNAAPNYAPYAEATMTSKHLIPGEQVALGISLRGARADSRPAPPSVPNTAVNFARFVTQIDTNRNLSEVYQYRVTPAKPGTYTVPSVTMTSGGKQYQTQPITFHVHDPSTLKSIATGRQGGNLLIGWFPSKTTLYQGEQCPITLKVYAPQQLRLASWGLPDPTKKNCTAWRFSLPELHQLSRVHIKGIPHLAARYTTTLSGITPGTATLGPTKLRIVARERIIDPRFGPRISDIPLNLTLPDLTFNIIPLPEGAPDDFQGAIGQFAVRAECSKSTLADTDTIEVQLQVGGTGNLESIQPPVITESGWKVIDTSKVTRGEERRFASGVVTFRQLLRPERSSPLPTEIPPYSFTFFNPETKAYYTLKTKAIPVSITATSAGKSSSKTNTPSGLSGTGENSHTQPEEMRAILGFIEKPSLQLSTTASGKSLFWHLIPATICLLIIATPLYKKIKAASMPHPDQAKKQEALTKLADPSSDTRTFYRRAGRFIDQWLKIDPELATIIEQRDHVSYLPDDAEIDELSPDRKKEIIALLKRYSKLSVVLLCTSLSLFGTSDIAAQHTQTRNQPQFTALGAWKTGQYERAIHIYQHQYPDPATTPADVLFNIGTCHHRLGELGHAALAWRQALAQQPNHTKARQNLRFVEHQTGAITPDIQAWQDYLTYIHPDVFIIVFYIALWLMAIIILLLIFSKSRPVVPLLILLFCMPVLAIPAAVGYYFYPDTDRESPFEQQAVCLKKTKLYAEAHRLENDPPSLPPASLVVITATRDTWSYIRTADGQSGWVDTPSIAPVRSTR